MRLATFKQETFNVAFHSWSEVIWNTLFGQIRNGSLLYGQEWQKPPAVGQFAQKNGFMIHGAALAYDPMLRPSWDHVEDGTKR